jgi:hypothetical protein
MASKNLVIFSAFMPIDERDQKLAPQAGTRHNDSQMPDPVSRIGA